MLLKIQTTIQQKISMHKLLTILATFSLVLASNTIYSIIIREKRIDDFTRIGMSYQPSMSFNIVGIVHFKGSIAKKTFTQALDILQENHTFLQVHIANDSLSFTTENACKIPLNIQTRSNSEQWKAVVDTELHTPFDVYTSPLIRVVYIAGKEEGEIIWTLNHMIGDGTSRTQLITEFFEIVQSITQNKAFKATQDTMWDTDIFSLVPDNMKSEPAHTETIGHSVCDTTVLVENRHTCFIPHEFTIEETDSIQANYRKHNSSLQGALSAALALVVAEKIEARNGNQTSEIICHHPINLRPYLGLGSNTVGNCISTMNTKVTVNSKANIWDLAHTIKKDLNQFIEDKVFIKNLYNCQKLSTQDLPAYEIYKRCNMNCPAVAVSQLGTFSGKLDYDQLRITSMRGIFNWAGLYNHPDMFICTAQIVDKKLLVTFVYAHPLVSHEEATSMAQKAITKLLSIKS